LNHHDISGHHVRHRLKGLPWDDRFSECSASIVVGEIIEKRMFSQVEDLLPVISFGSKRDGETEKKHDEFVRRMVARGYTERQVRRLVEWYMRVKQAG
jgi:predicted Ser/Thr protein kinase